MKNLTCMKCGKQFNREDRYFNTPQLSVLSKWKSRYCDDCVSLKVDGAFKKLPEVMDMIMNLKEDKP